jgi:hypothetical protein
MWSPFASLARIDSSRPRPSRRRRAARPRLEPLEGRAVLSAVFDSVLTIGSDTAALTSTDNAVDAAGNTYVTGMLAGAIDFDPEVFHPDGSDILTPRGETDAYVAKYAPDNSLIWARRMGSDRNTDGEIKEKGEAVSLDGAGNVLVAGLFYEQADFGPITVTSAGSSDAFIAKLDTSGNVLWAKGRGGTGQEYNSEIATDAAGNVVWAGRTGTTGFEVRKYSPTGSAVWSKAIVNTGGAAGGVATDASGNVFVCGAFNGTVDFNPDPKKTAYVTGATAASGVNGYVLKLTAAGVFGWVAPFVAKTAQSPDARVDFKDIAVDSAGSVIVGGRFRGQVDFNPSASVDTRLPYTGDPVGDGVVVKLSSGGALTWATPLGGGRLNAVAVDASGAVHATGNFGTTFTPGFGLPALTNNDGPDVFVTKLSASGAVLWASAFGGTLAVDAFGIAVDASGTIHLAGQYYGTVDFDPDSLTTHERTNPDYLDLFLLKLRQS